MTREEVHKLLGGYATGTLTGEEQQALFAAALEDQELFDALAREQSVREVLVDPASRAHLLAAIDDKPAPWYRRWVPIAAVAAGLASIAIVGVLQNSRAVRPVKMAKLEFPAPSAASSTLPLLPPPPDLPKTDSSLQRYSLPVKINPVVPPPPRKREDLLAEADNKAPAPVAAPRAAPPPAPTGSALQPGVIGGFLPSPVPVRGTVTDLKGDAIRSATVEVKSLTTGVVDKTSTDENGQFNTREIPGRNYEIQAYAPGYQPMILNTVPVTGDPGPVNLKLEVDKAKDSVKVASADAEARRGTPVGRLASPVKDEPVVGAASGNTGAGGGGGGRGGRGQAGLADAATLQKQAPAQQSAGQQGQPQSQQAQAQAAPAAFGTFGGVAGSPTKAAAAKLEYHLMRRMPDGTLAETIDGKIPAGEVLIVRVTPPSDGFLSIGRRGESPIVDQQVHGQQPFDATLPKFERKGAVELDLIFSTAPRPPAKRSSTIDGLSNGTQLTIKINVQ